MARCNSHREVMGHEPEGLSPGNVEGLLRKERPPRVIINLKKKKKKG